MNIYVSLIYISKYICILNILYILSLVLSMYMRLLGDVYNILSLGFLSVCIVCGDGFGNLHKIILRLGGFGLVFLPDVYEYKRYIIRIF